MNQPRRFSDLNIKPSTDAFVGNKIEIDNVLDVEITVTRYKIEKSKFEDKGNGLRLVLQIKHDGRDRIVFTGSGVLMDMIEKVPQSEFPFITTIKKENKRFQFT